jgi:hypothetical protein
MTVQRTFLNREKLSRRKGENIMTNKVINVLLAGALSLAPALYGQADPSAQQKKSEQKQQADRPGEETLTGCLTQEQGSFKLSTSAGGQIDVTGPADLNKHKDHTVRLTGSTATEAGKKTLKVSKIENVSASCAK